MFSCIKKMYYCLKEVTWKKEEAKSSWGKCQHHKFQNVSCKIKVIQSFPSKVGCISTSANIHASHFVFIPTGTKILISTVKMGEMESPSALRYAWVTHSYTIHSESVTVLEYKSTFDSTQLLPFTNCHSSFI